MQYAKVVDICILKCPTLKIISRWFFIEGVQNFVWSCVNSPRIKKKKKKTNSERKKRGKMQKNMKGGVCEGQCLSQKVRLDKRNNICFVHFFRKHSLIAKMWRQSLKTMNCPTFFKGILKQNSTN